MQIPCQKIRPDAQIPERATDGSVGYDVYASRVLHKHTKEVLSELPFDLEPDESVLIGIGVRFAVPFPYQVEVRPRSGLASKFDIELSNSPGTIDPDFRGEAGVLLRNRGKKVFRVEKNMRVAQLVISETAIPVFEEVGELPATRRGAGGFGSTGFQEIPHGLEETRAIELKMDLYFMGIAISTAMLSTCVRGIKETGAPTRQFGCVIVKNRSIISSGCNGFYPGQCECTAEECIRESGRVQSGAGVEVGGCAHAEWLAISNLLQNGSGVSTIGCTVYVNAEPCRICAKLLTLIQPEAVVIPRGAYLNHGVEILTHAGVIVRYIELKGSPQKTTKAA